MSFIKYIADERSAQRDACSSKNHYKDVLSLVGKDNKLCGLASSARTVAVEIIVLTR
jgi:hypothetical protein